MSVVAWNPGMQATEYKSPGSPSKGIVQCPSPCLPQPAPTPTTTPLPDKNPDLDPREGFQRSLNKPKPLD